MTNKNRLTTRTAFSNAIRNELLEGLQQLSKESQVPISRLLDEAVEDLLKKRNPNK